MDLPQLCAVLKACLSASQEERTHAEHVLKQHEGARGQVVNLLRVAAEPGVELGVRQVAAISFKNTVKRKWDPKEGPPQMCQEDKEVVRSNLLDTLILAPLLVQSQLGEVFKSILYCDYPQQWPGLLHSVLGHISSQEEQRVYGGLYALRIMARKYEFRDEDERAPQLELVAASFPVILPLLQALVAAPDRSTGAAACIKLAVKVFWSTCFMGIPDIMLQEGQFTGWMGALHALLALPVPQEGQPTDPVERVKWPWWKAKKWGQHISYRLYTRYGDPARAKPGPDKAFAQLWATHCSARFLEAQLGVMQALAAGQYVSPRVVNLSLQYLQHALEDKASYKLLKPHLEGLLLGVVFPLMCFSDEDAELWEEDPQEYIRKGYDILEDMYSTKTAAANWAHELVSKKPKAFLDRFMAALAGVTGEYTAAAAVGTRPPLALERRMDGALLAIGTLHSVLRRKSPYKEQLEPLMARHVLPCFSAAAGHLRAKAAWISGVYSDIPFAGGAAASPVYRSLFSAVMNGLGDAELPVRVDAVVALRAFVDELNDLTPLKPLLPALLEAVFGLMNQVDNEDLVFTLESIVDKFGEEIGPWALDLATNLAAAFWRYSRANATAEDDDEEDDDDSAALAAYGCLKALNTLLDSCSGLPQLYPALEEVCWPIMEAMVSTEGQDVFEDVLEMAAYFTYFSEPCPSQRLWRLWPLMEAALLEWAIDYWDNILTPLDNLISKGTETFLGSTNPDYLQSVYKMVHHSLAGDYSEADITAAPKLLSVVLQACRGRVDAWVAPYLRVVLERLPRTQRRSLKDALLGVVGDALYYNAGAALAALAAMGAAGPLLAAWLPLVFERRSGASQKSLHFRSAQDKKVAVLGLASVLGVEALPPEVEGALPQLLAALLKLLIDLKLLHEEQDRHQQQGSDAEDDEEEVEEEAADEEEEDDDGNNVGAARAAGEDEAAYDARLRRTARELLGLDGGEGGGDDDDDDDDDEWSDDAGIDIGTPLDPIDPFVFFAEALAAVQARAPSRYQALTSRADAGVLGALQGMMAYAAAQAARKQREEQQQQQQAQGTAG